MSSLFGSGKSATPDPNALPAPESADESVLKPGADADLDPAALLQRDQVAANALAAARGVTAIALTAPYLTRARTNAAQARAERDEATRARARAELANREIDPNTHEYGSA